MRVLVVSATRVEARYVPEHLPLLVSGVGKVAAGVAVATALAQDEVDLVVNVGSAGGLRPDATGLLLPSQVLNHDFDAATLRAMGLQVTDTLDLPDGDGTVLATGDAFVADPEVRDRLAARAAIVDMEGFAVAWACARAGVACRLVKHVSDPADSTSLDWPALVDLSARALGGWLREHLPA